MANTYRNINFESILNIKIVFEFFIILLLVFIFMDESRIESYIYNDQLNDRNLDKNK